LSTKAALGLGNVDNTSDASKPISSAVSAALDVLQPGALTVGESTIARDWCSTTSAATATGVLRLSYFTARVSETTTQVRVISGATAAGATPTLVRIGFYSIASDGAGTLVASTASDTALFAAATAAYTKSWSSSYAKTAGQRYALGVLVVTAATAPTLLGINFGAASELAIAPRLAGSLSSQSDLPSSFTGASVATSGSRFYGVVLP